MLFKLQLLLKWSQLILFVFKLGGMVFIYYLIHGFDRYLQPRQQERAGLDVWQSFDHHVPDLVFSLPRSRSFADYLEFTSQVKIRDVQDICNWLAECQYVEDIKQFFKRDYWQHPHDFELNRKGDCEDYALWAWNQLLKLGIEAEFVVGIRRQGERHGGHAWVQYRDEYGVPWLMECVARTRSKMLIPLPIGPQEYVPFASVNGQQQRRAYMGLLYWRRRLANARVA